MNKRQRKKQKKKNGQMKQCLNRKNQKDSKKTLKKIFVAIGGVGGIVAILTVILQFFDITSPIRAKPNADIMNGTISVKYLESIRNDEGKDYPLFHDNVKDILYDNCATQVFIENNYEEEILLDKIIFEAQEINVNAEPVLQLRLYTISSTEIVLEITNIGWEEAEEIEVRFETVNGDIDKYVKEEKQTVKVPFLDCGESMKLSLWSNQDFFADGNLQIIANCWGKSGEIESNADTELEYVSIQNGEFVSLGKGGPSNMIYGIVVDTSEENYIREERISETIEPNGRLELPICFSADKSCSMKFKVGFEIVKNQNKTEVVWTDYAELEFKIPFLNYEFEEAKGYSEDELIEKLESFEGQVLVTYPYVDKDNLKHVGRAF